MVSGRREAGDRLGLLDLAAAERRGPETQVSGTVEEGIGTMIEAKTGLAQEFVCEGWRMLLTEATESS